MSWIGVVTNAGKALLAQWLGGGTFNIDSAAEGSGTVDAAALFAQTALVNQRKVISILGAADVPGGKKIKLRITSEGVMSAHVCNQLGIWASLDGGAQHMIGILQSTVGQPVPTHADAPDFVWDFYAIVEMSNTGTFTLTIDTSVAATVEDIEAHNADEEAHPSLSAQLVRLEGLTKEITGIPVEIAFDAVEGLVIDGHWNEALQRVEF